MKDVKVGFFQEKEGVYSIMRLNTSLLVWAGMFVLLVTALSGFIGVSTDNAAQNVTIGFGMIGTGITGKFVQKFGEK